MHLGDSVVSGQSLHLLHLQCLFLHDLTTRGQLTEQKKLFVSVSVQLTNAWTSRHELHIGHLVSVSVGLLISVEL